MVGGLGEEAGKRIAASRPHASIAGLAQCSGLSAKEAKALAAAGALDSLSGHRRNARWVAAGVQRSSLLLPSGAGRESAFGFAPAPEGEEIAADYASLGFTLRRHPLALLRGSLASRGFVDATTLNAMPDGRRACAAGLVTCRQHPDTKTGVTFVTLEDETGSINVVVWKDFFEHYRTALLGAKLLGVQGVVQKEGLVVHLVGRRFEDHSLLLQRALGELEVRSHDFH
jgi:error-prone DNA polymerase